MANRRLSPLVCKVNKPEATARCGAATGPRSHKERQTPPDGRADCYDKVSLDDFLKELRGKPNEML